MVYDAATDDGVQSLTANNKLLDECLLFRCGMDGEAGRVLSV